MAVWNVLAHTDVGSGGAASVTYSSISQSYDHLLLQASVRSSNTGSYADETIMQVNSSTNYAHYSQAFVFCSASTIYNQRWDNNTGFPYFRIGYLPQNNSQANGFSGMNLWFPNYAGTTGLKQIMIQSVVRIQGANTYGIWDTCGLFHQTSGISTLKIYPHNSSDSFTQHSTLTLYGIKGA